MMINFEILEQLAMTNGAAEIYWRESEVSESGAVAEIDFEKKNRDRHDFFRKIANCCERMIRVRSFENYSVASVPCEKPETAIKLGYASRGSRLDKLSLRQLFEAADLMMEKDIYQS